MKEQRHGSFGILTKDLGAEIYDRLFSLILSAARVFDRTLLLEQLPKDLDSKIILLDNCAVDGIIIFSELPEIIQKRLATLHEEVLYVNTNKRVGPDAITIDDETAGYAAAKKLIEAGRKRLVYITWRNKADPHYSIKSRLQGIQDCCNDHNIKSVKAINIDGIPTDYIYTELAEKFIFEKIKKLDFDGVVLHSDLIGPAFYNAIAELNKQIPEDCSVVSFNNSKISYALKPKLASFGLNDEETSKLIIKRMVDLVDGKKDLEEIKLSMQFFEGKSI